MRDLRELVVPAETVSVGQQEQPQEDKSDHPFALKDGLEFVFEPHASALIREGGLERDFER